MPLASPPCGPGVLGSAREASTNTSSARSFGLAAQQQRRHTPRRQRAVAPATAAAAGDAAAAHAAAAVAAAGRDAGREVAVLGGEDYILSQRSGVTEQLFKGDVLGVDADIASTDFRQTYLRSLAHVPEGLQPSPRFLERVAVHYARNMLAGLGELPGQVPLILGIWGPKGVGKTFTLELCLRRMGVMPVCLSAGELEDEWAGEPGRRLRERYGFAARLAHTTGQATALVISDLDIGVGTIANTFNTVNTQNLQGSLMALCDDPLLVSQGQAWDAVTSRLRVPIYITANDLTCLYAPLVREGRMDKFFFEPTREEMASALQALFAPELDAAAVDVLLDAFPAQPMDFFGAIRSRLVDDSVRRWLREGAEGALSAGLAPGGRAAALTPDGWSLNAALAAGAALAAEQQAVLDNRLVLQYVKGLEKDLQNAPQRQLRWRRRRQEDRERRLAAAEAAEAARREAAAQAAAAQAEAGAGSLAGYWEHLAANSHVSVAEEADLSAAGHSAQQTEAAGAQEEPPELEPAAPATSSGLPGISPDQLAAALKTKSVVLLDVRSAREWDWGRINGAVHAPFVLTAGSSLAPETKPNPGFLAAAQAKLGPPDAARPVVLYGPGAQLDTDTNEKMVSKEKFVSLAPNAAGAMDGQDVVAAAVQELQAAGYTALSELAGGYRAWDLVYRPDGRRRARGAFRDKSSGDLEWWTASN